MPATLYHATLKSISPYSQSQRFQSKKESQETHDAFEKRVWRERLHVDKDGNVFIPPMAFRNALNEAAKFLSMKIPGQGQKTYTKIFERGLLLCDEIPLPVKAAEVPGQWLFVPADGKPGGGTRVDRCFPVIQAWEAKVPIHTLHDLITEEILRLHLEAAGSYIGIGYFRPQNRGYWGRFEVVGLKKA